MIFAFFTPEGVLALLGLFCFETMIQFANKNYQSFIDNLIYNI